MIKQYLHKCDAEKLSDNIYNQIIHWLYIHNSGKSEHDEKWKEEFLDEMWEEAQGGAYLGSGLYMTWDVRPNMPKEEWKRKFFTWLI